MNEQQNSLIEQHLEKVLEINEYLNLTRIASLEQGRLLHVEDSLSALPEMDDSPEGDYADLGSGGGYPGIPLAIATGRNTLLVDSVKKKMKALDGIINELGLSNEMHTYNGRIEELALKKPNNFAVITARALSSLPSLLELAQPLLKPQGRLICYKANLTDEEEAAALGLQEKLGMSLVSKREFFLSDGVTHRTLIVFEKTGASKIKLPRKTGQAQNNPLK